LGCSLGGPQTFSPADTSCFRVDVTVFKRYNFKGSGWWQLQDLSCFAFVTLVLVVRVVAERTVGRSLMSVPSWPRLVASSYELRWRRGPVPRTC